MLQTKNANNQRNDLIHKTAKITGIVKLLCSGVSAVRRIQVFMKCKGVDVSTFRRVDVNASVKVWSAVRRICVCRCAGQIHPIQHQLITPPTTLAEGRLHSSHYSLPTTHYPPLRTKKPFNFLFSPIFAKCPTSYPIP